LRIAFAAHGVRYRDTNLVATISVGAAVFPTHGLSARDLLGAADNALYRAKSDGRNCVRAAIAPAPRAATASE